jgi:hypothetical protein
MSAKRKGQVMRDRDAATTNQDEKTSRKTKRQHNLERMSKWVLVDASLAMLSNISSNSTIQ